MLLPFYGHQTEQPALAGTPDNNWRVLLEQTYTVHVPLVTTTTNRKKTLQFSSTVLPAPSLYLETVIITTEIVQCVEYKQAQNMDLWTDWMRLRLTEDKLL